MEVEIVRTMMELAGYIAAGLLAQDSAEGPSMEEVAEVRRESKERGNPLKAPMRAYPVKAVMLSGLILCGSFIARAIRAGEKDFPNED